MVEEWDPSERKFVDKEIMTSAYTPLKHRYFSYQLWKEERNSRRQRRAHTKLIRERKRKERVLDEQEDEPKAKKSRKSHSDSPTV